MFSEKEALFGIVQRKLKQSGNNNGLSEFAELV